MPIGVIVNAMSVLLGGLLGAAVGDRVSEELKTKINMIFGLCAFGMGVSSIVLMENMPAVVFAMIVGTGIGICIRFGEWIQKGAVLMQRGIARFVKKSPSSMPEEEFMSTLITVIVLFCASGTGIYGSIVSGMSGDHSILIAKSILDFFTALIFACNLGAIVGFIAVPQLIIFLLLFLLAGVIYPLTTPTMINDFKACGGLLLFATGFRMIKVKEFPIADMIPAMVLAMPASWIWVTFIVPLIG